MTRNANYDRTIEMRQFKNFQKDVFLNDLEQMPWRDVSSHSDPNDMWQEWKNLFVSCMDKHAPLKSKRIRNKRSPWITSELLLRMRRRDVLKKKAISTNDHAMLQQFKRARNQVNNATKLAKKRYFPENLETSKGNPRKTSDRINELSSRSSCKSSNILEIQANNRTINNADDMTEAFNVHFTNIAKMLARDIPVGEFDAESFLSPSDNSFSLKPPSIDIVLDLLKKIDEKTATGLDKIPSKLLKMAASIVAPSLTDVFGIYPTEWKLARVTPIFKKGSKSDINNYRPISVIPVVSKVLEKLVYDQLYHYLNDNKLLSSCQSGFRSLQYHYSFA